MQSARLLGLCRQPGSEGAAGHDVEQEAGDEVHALTSASLGYEMKMGDSSSGKALVVLDFQ